MALIPLLIALWSLRHISIKTSGWHSVLPSHLAKHLIVGNEQKSALPRNLILIALVWILAVVALAGPTWQKRPQPVYQTQAGKVIVLDLSMSMRSDDIKPDRLTMARFKAIEIARQIKEGDIGLIGYAGDAFTISPLTPDNKNIINQIPSLSPEIMPVMGSNAYQAIRQAIALLKNAGHQTGDIFWITDGIQNEEYTDIQKLLTDSQFKLLTLGVGTRSGAPIKLKNGELLKDARGSIVVPRLEEKLLVQLSKINNGNYQSIKANDSDIQNLINQMQSAEKIKQEIVQNQLGDQWQESGPWLVLILLPLAAYAFRKGLIYTLILGFVSLPASNKVQANTLDSVFKTQNQQAYQALEQQDFEQAAKLAEDQSIKAAALFKQGEYEKAIEAYQGLNDPDSLYNQANAYANIGDLDNAIAKYDEALAQDPNFEKAKNNKALAEKLKQQQQNQQQNSGQDQQDGENQDSEQNQQNSDKQNNQQQNASDEANSDSQNGQQNQNSDSENNQQQDSESSEQTSQNEQQNRQQGNEQPSGEQNPDKSEHRSAEQMAEQQQQNAEQNQQAQSPQTQDENPSSEPQMQPENQQNNEDSPNTEAQVQTNPNEHRPLTEEERAEQEQNEIYRQLLNKVEDDPSYLIRRKMQLEYEKRRKHNTPEGVIQPW